MGIPQLRKQDGQQPLGDSQSLELCPQNKLLWGLREIN